MRLYNAAIVIAALTEIATARKIQTDGCESNWLMFMPKTEHTKNKGMYIRPRMVSLVEMALVYMFSVFEGKAR